MPDDHHRNFFDTDPNGDMVDEDGYPILPPKDTKQKKKKPNGLGDEKKEKAEALTPINPATLHGMTAPPREWLVPGWIPMARATSLYGGGGEGKTLLAQMLCTACALHEATWLGIKVRPCRSILLYCEDDLDEMWRRQEDINAFYNCTMADLEGMRWLPRLGYDNEMMMFEANGRRHLTELFHELLQTAQSHEAKLVIADTLADVFGGNENDRVQARAFVQTALGGMARETGGAVLALAHPSLSGASSGTGTSGSTGWIGTFRSHMHLSSPKSDDGEQPDIDARVLTRIKASYARRGETIDIRWKDGVFVTPYVSSGFVGSIEKRNCEDIFLYLLSRLIAEGRYVSNNPRAGNYCARLFAECPDRDGFKKKDFQLAMQRLFAAKSIRLCDYKDVHRNMQQRIEPATVDGGNH
jgi:RecA-family ATPase